MQNIELGQYVQLMKFGNFIVDGKEIQDGNKVVYTLILVPSGKKKA